MIFSRSSAVLFLLIFALAFTAQPTRVAGRCRLHRGHRYATRAIPCRECGCGIARGCDSADKELGITNPVPIQALNFNGDLDLNLAVLMYEIASPHMVIQKFDDPDDADGDCDYCRISFIGTQRLTGPYKHVGNNGHGYVYGQLLDAQGAPLTNRFGFGSLCPHACAGSTVFTLKSEKIALSKYMLAAKVRLTFGFPGNNGNDYVECP